MTPACRYAIYYAPTPDTPVWGFGSAVLGYDAATGKDVQGFTIPGFSRGDWRALTERPRTYGFHATLKAPFALQAGDEDALTVAMARFADKQHAFRLGPMAVTALNEPGESRGFVALTPSNLPPELAALEWDVVTGFDRFRQPLTETERSRRNPGRLTERQLSHLDAYGYPFVHEEFRFHMTLSGATPDASAIADMLADEMAGRIGTVDLRIDALCLFRQAAPNQRFQIVSRHSFGR